MRAPAHPSEIRVAEEVRCRLRDRDEKIHRLPEPEAAPGDESALRTGNHPLHRRPPRQQRVHPLERRPGNRPFLRRRVRQPAEGRA